jgi:hypothetical protein
VWRNRVRRLRTSLLKSDPMKSRYMRIAIAVLMTAAVQLPARAEHFFRPAPYGEGKIYLFAPSANTPKRPSADYVRSHPTRVISIGDDGPGIVHFWDYLRWGNAKNDPKIKQRAGPIRMVIDLYRRVQPQPPAKPDFETLYCTERFIYSDEGDYLELKPPVSTHLNSFLK